MRISVIDTGSYSSLTEAIPAGGCYSHDIDDTRSQTWLYGTPYDYLMAAAAAARCLDGNFGLQFFLQSDTGEVLDVATFSEGKLMPRLSDSQSHFIQTFVDLEPAYYIEEVARFVICATKGDNQPSGFSPRAIQRLSAAYRLWNIAQIGVEPQNCHVAPVSTQGVAA